MRAYDVLMVCLWRASKCFMSGNKLGSLHIQMTAGVCCPDADHLRLSTQSCDEQGAGAVMTNLVPWRKDVVVKERSGRKIKKNEEKKSWKVYVRMWDRMRSCEIRSMFLLTSTNTPVIAKAKCIGWKSIASVQMLDSSLLNSGKFHANWHLLFQIPDPSPKPCYCSLLRFGCCWSTEPTIPRWGTFTGEFQISCDLGQKSHNL